VHWNIETQAEEVIERAIGVIIKSIVERTGLTEDELDTDLLEFAEYISLFSRMDELERVRAATLDAENDVWSLTDEGEVISMNDRLEELYKVKG